MPTEHSTAVATPAATWTSLPLALSPQAERLTGADRQPMLYVAAEDRYILLSAGAARLLDALDGATTTAQILERVGDAGDPARTQERRQTVLQTLDGLRRAGAFTLSRGGGSGPAPGRWRRWAARTPRVRVQRGIEPLVAPPVDLALRHPRVTRVGLSALALASFVLSIAGVTRFPSIIVVMWPAVVAVVALEVVLHELAHAAVCRAFGVRIREAGVMLWAWFLPLAYVDCTDIYRLPGRRARIMVALAGPFVDLVVAGTAAAVALTTRGETAGTAYMVLLTLAFVLLRNLTPLLPTDGYQALEAATGELNLRARSWAQLRGWLTVRRPRRGAGVRGVVAAAATAAPRRAARPARRRAYVIYGAVSAVYTVAIFAFLVLEVRASLAVLG